MVVLVGGAVSYERGSPLQVTPEGVTAVLDSMRAHNIPPSARTVARVARVAAQLRGPLLLLKPRSSFKHLKETRILICGPHSIPTVSSEVAPSSPSLPFL